MGEVLQANIFFFVTGISVIVLTLLVCVGLYHVIRILKSVRRIIDRIEYGSEIIAEDMSSIREYFTETSFISRIVGAFFGQASSKTKASKSRKTHSRGTELTIKDED
jgi:hypothetical protein